jgi:hypothetical protein
MSELEDSSLGFVKSVTYDETRSQIRGMIQTIDDSDNSELPFIISGTFEMLEEGKLVRFVKKSDPLVPHAENVEKL